MNLTSYKQFLVIFIFLLFNNIHSVNAQNDDTQEASSKWFMTSGFGYYSAPGDNPGNLFYSEIGYQLPTHFNIGVGFGMGDVFEEYDATTPLFEGMRQYENYYLIKLFLNWPYKFGSNNNHQVKIGGGFVYIQPRFSYPRAYRQPVYDNQGNIVEYDIGIGQRKSSSYSIELGFPLIIEYGYSFSPLTVGARFEPYLLYAAGWGGYILSPQISLDF